MWGNRIHWVFSWIYTWSLNQCVLNGTIMQMSMFWYLKVQCQLISLFYLPVNFRLQWPHFSDQKNCCPGKLDAWPLLNKIEGSLIIELMSIITLKAIHLSKAGINRSLGKLKDYRQSWFSNQLFTCKGIVPDNLNDHMNSTIEDFKDAVCSKIYAQ